MCSKGSTRQHAQASPTSDFCWYSSGRWVDQKWPRHRQQTVLSNPVVSVAGDGPKPESARQGHVLGGSCGVWEIESDLWEGDRREMEWNGGENKIRGTRTMEKIGLQRERTRVIIDVRTGLKADRRGPSPSRLSRTSRCWLLVSTSIPAATSYNCSFSVYELNSAGKNWKRDKDCSIACWYNTRPPIRGNRLRR